MKLPLTELGNSVGAGVKKPEFQFAHVKSEFPTRHLGGDRYQVGSWIWESGFSGERSGWSYPSLRWNLRPGPGEITK